MPNNATYKYKELLVLFLLFIFLYTNLFCRIPNVYAAQSPSEDDWWLPSWVTLTPNSGEYLGENVPTSLPIKKLKGISVRWSDIEPQEGIYNWSIIRNALNTNDNYWLRIYNSDVAHVPQWLKDKYPTLQSRKWFYGPIPYGDPWNMAKAGSFYYIWDPNIDTEFKKLLTEFKNQGFGSKSNLLFMYVPGAWRWDEYQVWPDDRSNPISPTNYNAWFISLMNAYKDALGGDGKKLVYTGNGHLQWANDNNAWKNVINTPEGGNTHSDYVIQTLGGGTRDGLTEAFNKFGNEYSWGQRVSIEGNKKYVITDETHPLVAATDRFFATENECFNACDPTSPPFDYYHIKSAFLVMLKLRMNWVNTNGQAYSAASEMMDWAFKELGKHYYDSPDAWVSLRQWTNPNDNQVFDNWERWLFQREVSPGGNTVNTTQTTSWEDNGPAYYEAKRTDHSNGNDYMYFSIDDKFILGNTANTMIKVTYLDNNTSTWWIDYDSTSNAYTKSTTVTNKNDGKWKTTSFTLSDARFTNKQTAGMDFRIYNGGSNDLSVRFVRVIKLDPISNTTISPSSSPTKVSKQGDANNDSTIDGIDYLVWLNHYNTTTTNREKDGDFNASGNVDGQDFVIWLNNYGK